MRKKIGMVSLIGAGPGDPGFMTVKGLNRLQACDAVVYDHLASERFLEEVKEDCLKIYVGKQAGCHYKKQEEINRLLIELAEAGRSVVRLKGGDPFVFGRGGEEVLALFGAGIPFEVIPGVTSAVAALAAAGIPVTHRAVSRSFHVMTGHTMEEAEGLSLRFGELARLSGTLVFLMGLTHLPLIVNGLMEHGLSKDTPAAVVENGTLVNQRVVRGQLGGLEELVEKEGIKTPAIIVVGETAALDFSSTFTPPLNGVRVAVTGTGYLAERLGQRLQKEGALTECVLSMERKSHRNSPEMKAAYEGLDAYGWIVFTSANAVREFFAGLLEWGRDFRSLGHVKFATVGTKTAEELRRYGFFTDYTPGKFCVSSLADGLKQILAKGERILIPRSGGGSEELNQKLCEAGILYDDVVLYEVTRRLTESEVKTEKEPEEGSKRLGRALEKSDYLTFASGSCVDAFFDEAGESSLKLLERVRVVCIGSITAGRLLKHGRKADVTAETFTVDGLAEAMCDDWAKEANRCD